MFFAAPFLLQAQNVGIGTLTPTRPLTVKTDGIGIAQTSGSQTVQVGFYTDDVSGAFVQTHTPHDLHFSTNNGSTQILLKLNGNLGIGTLNPDATLTVARGTGTDGAAAFFGTDHVSHFNYNINEDTYIRGGKDGSSVIINDIPGARVGIGMSAPSRAMLEQHGAVGNTAAIFNGDIQGVSLQGGNPGIGLNHYFDGTNNRSLSVGYAGQFGLDETNGTLFYKAWSGFSVIPNGLLSNSNSVRKFNINRFGKAGFGSNSITADAILPDLAVCQSSVTPSSAAYERTNGLSLSYSNTSINNNNSIYLSLGDLVDGPIYTNALKIFGFPNGGPVAMIHPNTGEYIQLSDQQAKKDLQLLTDETLARLLQLRPARYHMQTDSVGARWKYGFIAQEIEKLFPDVVYRSGDYHMVSYQSLIPVAIRGLQEQQVQIRALIAENNELKSRLERLEKKIFHP